MFCDVMSAQCLMHSSKGGGTSSLNDLDLGCGERRAAEARGQLVAVEEDSLGGRDGAQLEAGDATDARAVALHGLAEGSELLGMVAVGAE